MIRVSFWWARGRGKVARGQSAPESTVHTYRGGHPGRLVPVHLTSERSHALIMMRQSGHWVCLSPYPESGYFPWFKKWVIFAADSCPPFLRPLQCVPSQSSTVVALSFDACSRCRLHGVFIHRVLRRPNWWHRWGPAGNRRGQSELKPPLVRAHLLRPGRSPFLHFPGLSPDHNAQNS